MTMLLQKTCALLLDNPDNDFIRAQCLPIVERFFTTDIDLTFLVAPVMAVIGRFKEEKLASLFFEKYGALTDVVIPRLVDASPSRRLDHITPVVSRYRSC